MGSPFPGTDPYIEACHLWDDFHHNLISLLQAAIGEILPERYVVRAGERSYTEFHEGFLEIREAHGDRQVVTSIEVLSPSHKRFGSEGWFE